MPTIMLKNEILEHYHFQNLFIRRTKKACISFIPKSLIEKIRVQGKRITDSVVRKRLQRRGIALNFGDLRENWATVMTRYLTPAEIDFLQGRVGISVFMKNYFNPALIGDLKIRVFRGIEEITKLHNGKYAER